MDKLDPIAAYPQLFDAFGKIQTIHPVIQQEFMKRSETILFKRNELITDGQELSTHGYFIISGLVMAYLPEERFNRVKWVRSTNDYAYSMDMFRFRFNHLPELTGNFLVALEDTLAVSIHHEDINWLQDNSVEMGIIINTLIMRHSDINLCIQQNEIRRPLDKYKEMQQRVPFPLNRVPDIYLSSFLNITLVELKTVRELMQ